MTLLKGIVAALVLANVGYFLWSNGIAKTPDTVIAGAGTLKLASEAPGAAVWPGVASVASTAAVAVPAGAASASGDSARLEEGTTTPVASSSEGGGAVAPTPNGPPTPSGTLAPSGTAAAADAAPPATGEAGAPSPLLSNVKRCVSVGPFRDVSEAARAAGTLRTAGYDPRQRVADGEVWVGVWVYLPLPSAQAAAQQILAKLKSAGIDDALEMPGPNDSSVISLGLFSEPKRAQARVAQAQALSLNPAIADRKRNGNVYWIDIDLKATDAMLNPADLQGEAGRIVRLEVKGCPGATAASR